MAGDEGEWLRRKQEQTIHIFSQDLNCFYSIVVIKVRIHYNMKLFNTNTLQQLSKTVKLSDSGPRGSRDCMMFVTLPQAKSVHCMELHFLFLCNTRAASSETERHSLGFMSPPGSP